MKVTPVEIAGRPIGPEEPIYVVAELSANHLGDLGRARRILEAAADAGADAIKLQTYTADTLTIDCDAAPFLVGAGTAWEGRTLHDLYREASTPYEWHEELRDLARSLGLHFFSSPFDEAAVDFLESLDVPAYKVASFEIVHVPLLQRIAATGKPVIVSTGLATLEEIAEAVDTLRRGGCEQIVLLRCVSAYPAAPEDMHLRTLPHLSQAFGVPVGLSDHTLDLAVPVVGAALGACVLEKHLTLARADGGPDGGFSLEPAELEETISALRVAQGALGGLRYGPSEREGPSRVFRRSLFVVADVEEGEALTPQSVRVIRPGGGLHPRYYEVVMGRRAARPLPRGTPLSWGDIA